MPNFEIHGFETVYPLAANARAKIWELLDQIVPKLTKEAVVTINMQSVCVDCNGDYQPFVRIYNSSEEDWPALEEIAEALACEIDVELMPTLRKFVPKKPVAKSG